MKKNLIVFSVLLLLALVPVTCTFIFSGDDEGGEYEGDEIAAVEETPVAAAARQTPGKGPTGPSAKRSAAVPVFRSFEGDRYQRHDALIAKYVADYNANRAKWAGATAEQAKKMPDLTVEQVKAHMIQETGGGDVRSKAAWAKDPLQVNVPGDWNPYKKLLGLRKPRKRNEGSLAQNLKAGIMLLARKAFGVAGQPAANNASGSFDSWKTALRRYNGRSDKAATGRPYREEYADRILKRAKVGARSEVEIPIKTK